MNERIKELMDEAVRFRLDPDSKQYEAQVSPEDLEMFAELIVRECADISEVSFHNGSAGYLAILNHFGVEQ
jgi:hypothetical protein